MGVDEGGLQIIDIEGIILLVQVGQKFKTVGYGCTSCWSDVGAGDAEADVISFIGY